MSDKFKEQWTREAPSQPGVMLDVISLDTDIAKATAA